MNSHGDSLLASQADWADMRSCSTDSPWFLSWREANSERCVALLAISVGPFGKEGRRMLHVSRRVLGRVLQLAVGYHLERREEFASRAISEVDSAVALDGWNPDHFLDTAEMGMAVAIASEWLGQCAGEERVARWRKVLWERVVVPSLDSNPARHWVMGHNNWTQVCHAGVVAAALANRTTHPEMLDCILDRAVAALAGPAEAYAPDGAYAEGPSYWAYGTSFHVLLIEMIRQATGSSKGLDDFPGFCQSAEFIKSVTAPSGKFYSYGDSSEERAFQPALFWFAHHLKRPEIAIRELQFLPTALDRLRSGEFAGQEHLLPLFLLWGKDIISKSKDPPPTVPLSFVAQGPNPVAILKGFKDNRSSAYLGIKGGSASIPHGQMDAGSFVYENAGVRWAIDPGLQDYHSLESAGIDLWNYRQNSSRWEVFRLGIEGHSVLRPVNWPWPVEASAGISKISSSGDTNTVVIDLSDFWGLSNGNVTRTVTLRGDGSLEMIDRWSASVKEPLRWQWVTRADVCLQTAGAHFRSKGRAIDLKWKCDARIEPQIRRHQELARSHDVPDPELRRVDLTIYPTGTNQGQLIVSSTSTFPEQ